MYTDNVIEFIRRGLSFKPIGKNFKKGILSMLCFPFLALILACEYAGYIKIISVIMCILWIISYIIVLVLLLKPENVVNRLIMSAIIYFTIVCQTSLFMAAFIISVVGINIYIVLIYIPLIVIPAVFCTMEAMSIKKNKTALSKRLKQEKLCLFFHQSELSV